MTAPMATPRTERSVHLGDDWRRTPMGLWLPPKPTKAQRYSRPVAVDLFCGAGGAGCGLHQGGFHVAAAMEFEPYAAITYTTNLARPGLQFHFDTDDSRDRLERALLKETGLGAKGTDLTKSSAVAGSGWIMSRPPHERGCEHFFFGDARNFTGRQILDALGLELGEVDLVFGGPPCQGFSMGGKRNVHDPRNSLVFEWARLVVEMQPAAFVFENVPGITSMVTPEGTPVLDELARYLQTGGMGTAKRIKEALTVSAGAGVALRGWAAASGSSRPKQPPTDDADEPREAAAPPYEQLALDVAVPA